jgi:hypothetical protein
MKVVAKQEIIHHHGILGFWSRTLRITVVEKGKKSAIDTDETTFDRATIGSDLSLLRTAAPTIATGPQRVAIATVRSINSRHWGRSETIDLAFVPEGRAEPVIAVDEIDVASVGGLAKNGAVKVVYPIANPRLALISGATRNFRWRDPLGGWGPMVLFLAAALMLVTLLRSVRRRGARAVAH